MRATTLCVQKPWWWCRRRRRLFRRRPTWHKRRSSSSSLWFLNGRRRRRWNDTTRGVGPGRREHRESNDVEEEGLSFFLSLRLSFIDERCVVRELLKRNSLDIFTTNNTTTKRVGLLVNTWKGKRETTRSVRSRVSSILTTQSLLFPKRERLLQLLLSSVVLRR